MEWTANKTQNTREYKTSNRIERTEKLVSKLINSLEGITRRITAAMTESMIWKMRYITLQLPVEKIEKRLK